VTGAAGFIGSHVSDAVKTAGHELYGIDDFSSGARNLDAFEESPKNFIEHNLWRDELSLEPEAIEFVVHCAAYPELRHNWESKQERDRLYLNNIQATTSVLEEMPERAPIIFLSSASVYGSSSGNDAFVETSAFPETIESPYAASKMAGEALVAAYAYKRKVPWYVLRLVNAVGTRQHRGVISDFVKMANAGHIHAADDGKQRKSWVHVKDVADAVTTIIRETPPAGIYNVTSRERISWWDIVDEMGFDRSRVTYENRDRGAIGDPVNIHVSGEKLGVYYQCRRSVREGIRESLEYAGWTRKPFDDFAEPEEPLVP